ncbi:methyl-accepting chemotaxis protein [Paraglaciecola arctica]|uniref:Hemolysin secretion protein n=1 Tax=Paraglaciecola arctica BSs20135 TaxID=493475 RepID=K6YAN7_9ALTE|nr:methyl-accepting chemotaxis protein [Paraglaciecola arctica]GAC21016.1 hemolysin secretion protein [Paraglaciecola arctica BSs20135]
MTINDLSIRSKFAIPLLSITLMLILISVLSLWSNNKLTHNVDRLSDTFLNSIEDALNADRDLYQALTASQNYLLKVSHGNQDTSGEIDSFNENAKQALDRMNSARALLKNYPEVGQSIASFEAHYKAWLSEAQKVFALADAGKIQEATKYGSNQVLKDFEILRTDYDLMGSKARAVADRLTLEAKESSEVKQTILIVLIVFSLIVCTISVVVGPRLVTTRVFELNDVIKTISDGEGDLRSRLNAKGKDELATLAGTFNGLMSKLQSLIIAIKNDATTLDTAVEDLNDSTTKNQTISEEQSINLHQISDAMTQMGQAIHEIALSAQTAQSETETVKHNTAMSTEIVGETAVNINRLSDAILSAKEVIGKLATESNQIVQVLDVIRSIADQTNLLALNAAIEAARAGEYGRGFAVVADEVRTLASRTQKSTEDIQKMIGGLEKGVEEAVNAITIGSNQVEDVVNMSQRLNDSLELVNGSVTETTGIIIQIAAATEEQSAVVDDINRTIALLNGLSIDGNEVTLQTNTVSTNISHLAKDLNGNVGRFKV